MDLFQKKDIKVMLISEEKEAFDDKNYIYELKLDGIRCLAYIDKNSVDLRNKRNDKVLFRYPELSDIYKQLNCTNAIFDGELFILKDNKTDFYEMQRRSLMSDKFKIELASKNLPVSFSAFDILYKDNQQLTDIPLIERKEILQNSVKENDRISTTRYIETEGKKLFELTTHNELEGIVAKKKDSKYYFGKRTKDWIKIKNYEDDDFVICGYIEKEANITSIIVAKYNQQNKLIYKGHVTLGVSNQALKIIKSQEILAAPLFDTKDNTIWIVPNLVCTVKYMHKTESGGIRQPVFKGLSEKSPYECKI